MVRPRGPNGGYLAAIVLRALTAAVDDRARSPRSLTIQYHTPADEAPATVTTRVERRGRSLTACSARLVQSDRVVATAMSSFSSPRPGPEFCDISLPTGITPAAGLESRPLPPEAPPIAHRWESRWALGRPPEFVGEAAGEPAREAVAGGWIRLREPAPLDAAVVAAITDAWVPPIFSRTNEVMVVPTIDLTVHFRTSLPLAGLADDDFCFVVFRTSAAAEGFLEEDGEVWSADGRLLAQSRQLAAILPFERRPFG